MYNSYYRRTKSYSKEMKLITAQYTTDRWGMPPSTITYRSIESIDDALDIIVQDYLDNDPDKTYSPETIHEFIEENREALLDEGQVWSHFDYQYYIDNDGLVSESNGVVSVCIDDLYMTSDKNWAEMRSNEYKLDPELDTFS